MHQVLRPAAFFSRLPHRITLEMLHRAHTGFAALSSLDKALQGFQIVKDTAVRYPTAAHHESVLELHPPREVQLGTAEGHRNRRSRHQRELSSLDQSYICLALFQS